MAALRTKVERKSRGGRFTDAELAFSIDVATVPAYGEGMDAIYAATTFLVALAAVLAAFAAVERGLASIILNGHQVASLLKKTFRNLLRMCITYLKGRPSYNTS
jgi:hypothetical protein